MKTLTTAIILSILLALFATPASAEGLPSFDEPVCNVLLDGTPGLFQLCDNYCEVRDCDSYPEDEQPRSCSRILATYNLRKTSDDPDMPCLDEGTPLPPDICPCWSLDEVVLTAMLVDSMDLVPDACTFDASGAGDSDKANYDGTNSQGDFAEVDFRAGSVGFHFCTYRDNQFEPVVDRAVFDYTNEENEACRAMIHYLQEEHFGSDCTVINAPE